MQHKESNNYFAMKVLDKAKVWNSHKQLLAILNPSNVYSWPINRQSVDIIFHLMVVIFDNYTVLVTIVY